MKGKKEGGEIKGREGGKRGKGEKEREKKGEREKKPPEFHSRARTRDLPLCSQPPMATAWRVDSHIRTTVQHAYRVHFLRFCYLCVSVLIFPKLKVTRSSDSEGM